MGEFRGGFDYCPKMFSIVSWKVHVHLPYKLGVYRGFIIYSFVFRPLGRMRQTLERARPKMII